MNNFFFVTELAKFFKVCPKTIYRRLWAKGIPAYKVGRRWRIGKKDISWLKRYLTIIKGGDKMVTMKIQEKIREVVYKRGLRKVARELGIDHASLYRSINSDLRLSTMQAILDLLGYDLKIVKRRGVAGESDERREKGKHRI